MSVAFGHRWIVTQYVVDAFQVELSAPTVQSPTREKCARDCDDELDYPALAGKRVRIELRSAYPLGEREASFLEIVVREHLEPADIEFAWLPIKRSRCEPLLRRCAAQQPALFVVVATAIDVSGTFQPRAPRGSGNCRSKVTANDEGSGIAACDWSDRMSRPAEAA
jgi:hypothetical protein